MELIYPRKAGAGYTRFDITSLIDIQQAKYAGRNLTFMVSLNIPYIGFRCSKQFRIQDPTILNDQYDDWEAINQFVIYTWANPNNAGGSDEEFNDCLYICILKTLDLENIKNTWNSPSKFKKRLGLERLDKVSIEKMPEIEKALRLNINVSGDYNYTSANEYPKTANIKFVNEHYKLVCKKSKKLLKQLPNHE